MMSTQNIQPPPQPRTLSRAVCLCVWQRVILVKALTIIVKCQLYANEVATHASDRWWCLRKTTPPQPPPPPVTSSSALFTLPLSKSNLDHVLRVFGVRNCHPTKLLATKHNLVNKVIFWSLYRWFWSNLHYVVLVLTLHFDVVDKSI